MDNLRGFLSNAASSAVQALPYIVDGMTTEGRPNRDHVGHRYFADNARIIFVNGVGSREHHCRENAEHISKIFDNSRVDYVYVPLAIAAAGAAIAGHTEPDGGTLLLHTILDCDDDLESLRPLPPDQRASRILKGGERIICFVHSGGGATFESIKDKIPPEVLDRIDLLSFGSAQLFRPDGFRNVHNFVAANDVVPALSSLVSGNIRALFDSVVTRQAPVLDKETSVESHQFLSQTHQSALAQLLHDYTAELTAH
jgi:hypothetical protein